jgi:hypothetical protein
LDHRVGIDFQNKKDKAAVINEGKEYYDVGDEESCGEVVQQTIGYNGKSYISSDEGDEPKKELHLGCQLNIKPIKEGEVGDDKE